MKKLSTVLLSAFLLCGCSSAKSEPTPSPSVSAEPSVSASAEATAEVTAAPEESSSAAVLITNPITLNTSAADMSAYTLLEDAEPAFVSITVKESIRMFTEKGSGILYYGRSDCPWCQRAVPVINQAAKEMGVTVYAVKLESGTYTNDDVDQLLECIDEVLVTGDEGEKEFQIPEVIAVKNGVIMDRHLALTDDFTMDTDETQMTETQKEQLLQIYETLIQSAAD